MKPAKPFSSTLTALMIGGLVPKDFKKSSLIFFFVQNCFYKVLFFISNCLAPTLHIFMYARGGHEYDSNDDFSEALGGYNILIIDVLFTVRWKQWLLFLEDISKDTEFGKDPGYDKLVKRLNYHSVVFSLYCCCGCVIPLSLSSFIASSKCNSAKKLNDLHIICGEFTPTWLIFKEASGVVSVTVFVFQTILFACMISCAITCFLIFEAAEMIVSHITNLKRYFEEVFDVPGGIERVERLRFCVRYHNYVLELANRLNDLCKYTTGVVTTFCAVCIAGLGSQIFNGNTIGTIWYLLGYLSSVFFLCHSGQRVKDEMYSIKDSVYASKWFEADAANMKDVRFIIARCQIPVCLETLPIGILDYPLFLLIVKTAYSFLTLMLSHRQA